MGMRALRWREVKPIEHEVKVSLRSVSLSQN